MVKGLRAIWHKKPLCQISRGHPHTDSPSRELISDLAESTSTPVATLTGPSPYRATVLPASDALPVTTRTSARL